MTAVCDMSGGVFFFWGGVAVISIGIARGGIRSTDAEIAAPSTEKVAVSKKVP